MTTKQGGRLVRLGSVANGYSNYLALLAVDASHAPAWRGPTNEDNGESDFSRANAATDAGQCEIDVGPGRGVVVEIGGCGASDVYRVGDALVMVEHYEGDSDADIEASFHDTIVSAPTVTEVERLGAVEVTSGALALVSLVEAVDDLDPAVVTKAASGRGGVDAPWGVMVGMPNGRYEIWREPLDELEGDWGLIVSRVRIVPEGTPVVPGDPIAAPTPRAARAKSATADARRTIAEWPAVASFAIGADGEAFAGENGGYRVCGWDASGGLRWQRELAPSGATSRYQYEVTVELAGDVLLAHPKGAATLYRLDPATGTVRGELSIPVSRTFALAPDGATLVLRTGTRTMLAEYPSGRVLATFDQYCNQNGIAMSRDGAWLAVNGHDVHVYDLRARRHATTFDPPSSPWAIDFTDDGRLVTADAESMLRVYTVDAARGARLVAERDVAPDRARKPNVTALAARGSFVAAGREDGTVVLLAADSLEILRMLDKHATAQPDTGANSLAQVGFAAGGKELWVSAGAKGEATGLAMYRL